MPHDILVFKPITVLSPRADIECVLCINSCVVVALRFIYVLLHSAV